MNILEQYIEEVHSVTPVTYEWAKEGMVFVEVDVTSNCYGNRKRDIQVFEKGEWEVNKKRGYWMA